MNIFEHHIDEYIDQRYRNRGYQYFTKRQSKTNLITLITSMINDNPDLEAYIPYYNYE